MLAAYWRNTWLDSFVMVTALLGRLDAELLARNPLGDPVQRHAGMAADRPATARFRWGYGPGSVALIQPAIVLALFQIGFLARMTRSAMLDVLDQDFIRTARAKGVDEWRTVTKHAFRNTLIPVVTVTGIILSLLIGGSVVIEQVFALPGIGRLIVQGILARDYPLVQGTMLIFGFSFVADQHRSSTSSTRWSIRGCALAELVDTTHAVGRGPEPAAALPAAAQARRAIVRSGSASSSSPCWCWPRCWRP